MMIFQQADWLRSDRNLGYGPMPIPQPLDKKIAALLEDWMRLDVTSREAAASAVSEDQRPALIGFGERMATLAVRSLEDTPILLGLVALCVDGWRGDWRDNAAVIALHYDAAQRVGVAPTEVFERAACMVAPKPAAALRAFLRRSAADKAIAAMGYEAGKDDDGFRYLRTW